MTEHQPTSLKEQLLESTFGSGHQPNVRVEINNEVVFEGRFLSARQLRRHRIERSAAAIFLGYSLLHVILQLAGFSYDPIAGWGWLWETLAIITFALSLRLDLGILKMDRFQRSRLEEFAYWVDDLVEANWDNFTPAQRDRHRSRAIDWMATSYDPTKYDKPWWRLRDPLERG